MFSHYIIIGSFFENVSLPNTRLPTTRTTIATSEVENTLYNGKNGRKRNKRGLSVAKVVVLVVVLPLVSIIVLAVIAYLKIRNRRNLRMTEAEANAEPSGSDLPLTGHDDEMVSERYRTAHNMKKMTTSQFISFLSSQIISIRLLNICCMSAFVKSAFLYYQLPDISC